MDFINCWTFIFLLGHSTYALQRQAIFVKQFTNQQVYDSVERAQSKVYCSACCLEDNTSCIGYIYDKYNKICRLVGERIVLETPQVPMMLLSTLGNFQQCFVSQIKCT